ncbi:MAG TPA: tRNA pseudouridine(13) synthase TruD [Thermoplasmata archaeon]|jgi:tRNA pseudouridine13 synthase|nr:MAG TPA: tRNA pseudouridine(13) synthase TruD [Thermoplasmata archaeon]
MKLKQQPADFMVEELPGFEASTEKDEHTVFLLEKQEIDTFDAIRRIAQRIRISLFEIGYAGLKDKHALARQYISIPTRYNVQGLKMDLLVLTLVGYSRKKIKVGDLKGNRFTIMVRDVEEKKLADIALKAETISTSGVPNYFDSQRFGSVIDNTFIGKDVILKKYEKAVKQYLTSYQKSEPKKIKDDKRKIQSAWNDLASVRVYNRAFAEVIKEYAKTKDWRAAYRRIPAHLREMFVNAYQSFLWNECVKEMLKRTVEKKKLYSVEYAIGALLFYTNLSEPEKEKIPLTFLTISETAMFTDGEQQIVSSVLEKEGLQLPEFRIEEEAGNFFKTRAREILLIPQDFTISKPERDEINSIGNMIRYKMQVSFSLPKGSYATVVTKRLFGH